VSSFFRARMGLQKCEMICAGKSGSETGQKEFWRCRASTGQRRRELGPACRPSFTASVSIHRQSRWLYGCWPLKGA
jgi:hypothetical protein